MHAEIIAELAQGFEGDLKQAKLLVRAAAAAGADAAKFQCVFADELATPDYEYYELFKGLEMPFNDWNELKQYCDSLALELILDVFGTYSLALSSQLKLRTIKLHATDINNFGFLSEIRDSHIDRIMVGAGGSHLDELQKAVSLLGPKNLIIFHGFQGYPTDLKDNQLFRIKVFKDTFSASENIRIGFSDHAAPLSPSSLSLPVFALGMGATVLEKHLTLGACMELEDYEAAMNPDQFRAFVDAIRETELGYGTHENEGINDHGMSSSEKQYRQNIRRHVIISKDICEGEIISEEDVCLKRSSSDQAITDIQYVYGKKVKYSIGGNMPLLDGSVE